MNRLNVSVLSSYSSINEQELDELLSAETGVPYMYMSRSDSTLRGHYPLETELLKEGIEKDCKS